VERHGITHGIMWSVYGITQCYLTPDTGDCVLPQPKPSRPVLDCQKDEKLTWSDGWLYSCVLTLSMQVVTGSGSRATTVMNHDSLNVNMILRTVNTLSASLTLTTGTPDWNVFGTRYLLSGAECVNALAYKL